MAAGATSQPAPRGRGRAAIKPNGAGYKKSSISDELDVAVVVKRRPSETSALRPWSLAAGIVAVVIAVFVAYAVVPLLSTPSPQEESRDGKTLESRDEDSAAFVAWFKNGGGSVSDAITIANFPAMGRGIRANSAVEESDLLVSVPMDLIICRETIWKRASSELQPKFLKLQDRGDELITAFLLVEQFKNASSRWAPYLKVVPAYPENFEAIATPLFFDASAGDVDELQDNRMILAAKQERQQVKLAFQRFRRLFKSVLPPKTQRSGLSLEKRYMWTRFLVNSRAFSIRGERYLVPFGDIFNGKPQPQRAATASAGNGVHFLNYHRLQPGFGMEIYADRSIDTPGDQLFEDYGDNDNYIYFLYHGFLMDNNPFDCADLRLPAAEALDEAKQRILREYHHSEGGSSGSAVVCVTARGTVLSPHDKQSVQLLASLTTMDRAHMDTWCDPQGREMSLCLSHATQADQEQLLLQAIERRLESYETTLEVDEELLQKPGALRPGQRHAVRFRLSRKKILVSAIEHIRQRLYERVQRKATETTASEADFQDTQAHMESTATKITRFSQWISTFDFPVNHIELKYVSPSMGYGAFATKPLAKGEIYLSVPTDIVMNLQSAIRSQFLRDWVVRQRSSGLRWTESQLLLLHLLHEKFAPGHKSFWKPYLDVLPETDRLASPLFFDDKSAELELLRETVPHDLGLLVDDYRRRVDAEFEQFGSTGSLLPDWITLPRFRWAHAILDSRSIWWSGTRHLVPLLDMVNCVEISPDHAAHATRLDEVTNDAAVTRASWDFATGDHVVENYAQPNYIYMLYHGFALHENSHDCAHFHFDLLEARQLPAKDADRGVVIAQMERMQLFSWIADVCVGGRKPIEKLLRVALIAQSPRDAAAEERTHTGEITYKHLDAAEKETTMRLQTLEKALHDHNDDERSSQAYTYITQQHKFMGDVLTMIQDRRHSL